MVSFFRRFLIQSGKWHRSIENIEHGILAESSRKDIPKQKKSGVNRKRGSVSWEERRVTGSLVGMKKLMKKVDFVF